MTPRTKEIDEKSAQSWFSQELLNQKNSQSSIHDLTGEGSLFKVLHPALIKCRYAFIHSPYELISKDKCQEWFVSTFKTLSQAEAANPKVHVYGGYPYQIHAFLEAAPAEAILNFGSLGSIFISKNKVPEPLSDLALHHFELPIWLDYALSSELWSSAGKWTRFHERLHTQFEKSGLLINKDSPGYYPLKKETQWLKDHGFVGKISQNSYDLIMPWDFPLSGLVELEKVLARGP